MTIAVMKTKAEQALTEAFEAHTGRLAGSAAVEEARREAMSRFAAVGLPHRRVEEWKYTDLRNQVKDALPLSVADGTKATIADLIVALGPLAHVDAHRITFVNGHYRAELSTNESCAGLDVSPMSHVLPNAPQKVAAGLFAGAPQADAVAALNGALMSDGAIVRIGDKAKLDKPLLIVFLRAGSGNFVAVRNVISTGEGSEATIIEAHVCVPGSSPQAQISALTQLTVGARASLAHIKIASDMGRALHLAAWRVTLDAQSTYRGFQYTAGQGLARNDISVVYGGAGGKLDLSGAFLVRGHEHVDTTLVVDHAVPHCESRELFKGVLDNAGRGVFQGKIIVRPHAQKTDGKQMAQALMLSPEAEFDSKPELEIYADDVVCGHGTTSAELDEDLLFYCKSRGIPENAARALLIESFVGEALDKVEHSDLRAALSTMAIEWLGAATT